MTLSIPSIETNWNVASAADNPRVTKTARTNVDISDSKNTWMFANVVYGGVFIQATNTITVDTNKTAIACQVNKSVSSMLCFTPLACG